VARRLEVGIAGRTPFLKAVYEEAPHTVPGPTAPSRSDEWLRSQLFVTDSTPSVVEATISDEERFAS
jgi:hypothetical protein